ncbi:MAG: hypothetical protein WC696_08310 [Candidatus Methylopumilus sp.]|jgi:hypothetical protein
MENSDIFSAFLAAIIFGGSAFAVLSHTLKKSQRSAVIRWCLLVGGVGLTMLILFAMLNLRLPAKSALGLVFVALPALVCGLLLTA